MAYFTYFSPELIHLQKELTSGYHKELIKTLSTITDVDERLATIATYCGIMVDGYFSEKAVKNLYTKLTDALVQKRTIILLPQNYDTTQT